MSKDDIERDDTAREAAEDAAQTASDAPTDDDTDAVRRERDDYLDQVQRERAAFLNYKKWVERERRNWESEAVARFVQALLPFIDDVDRAIEASSNATDVESLREGFDMIARRFSESLSAAGAEEIAAEGEAFDPAVHEAIMQIEDADRPAGTVINATQRGFRIGDRLVRAAKVVVSKAPAPERSGSD